MLLKHTFYNRHTLNVAKDLLGCFLVRKINGKIIKGMITEVEAYRGEYDLACHASRGKTPRNKVMYGKPGCAYVYFVYGIYNMLNIVTEDEGFPAAILIRSVKIDRIEYKKTNGPGKLTKFLKIDKKLNGWDLTKGEKLWIEKPKIKRKFKIAKSPRVGIDYARHCKEWKWNFKLVTRNQ